ALQEKVLEAHQRILGDEHPDTLTSIYNLAVRYWDLSRRGDALELYEQELKTCRRIHGEGGIETLMSIANLIERYRNVGRLEDAATLESQLKQLLESVSME